MMELEGFLNFARDRLAETDEPLPCDPEDCAAVLGYLAALVPEYQLARQAEAAGYEERQADRRRAVLDGFRRARGAAAPTNGGNGNGNDDGNGNANPNNPRNANAGGRPGNPGRRAVTPPEAA